MSIIGVLSFCFLNTVFPKKSLTVLDKLASVGLLFFLFPMGLELDMHSIKRTGYKALCIVVYSIVVPFVLGIGASLVLRATISKGVYPVSFLVFMGVALSITAFPVLAELKLLNTDVGRIAMSATAVNDIAAWILLALAISLSGSDTSPLIPLWVLLSSTAFILFVVLAIRPLLAAMAKCSLEGEPVKKIYICITLTLVLACSFATNIIGIHALSESFLS